MEVEALEPRAGTVSGHERHKLGQTPPRSSEGCKHLHPAGGLLPQSQSAFPRGVILETRCSCIFLAVPGIPGLSPSLTFEAQGVFC